MLSTNGSASPRTGRLRQLNSPGQGKGYSHLISYPHTGSVGKHRRFLHPGDKNPGVYVDSVNLVPPRLPANAVLLHVPLIFLGRKAAHRLLVYHSSNRPGIRAAHLLDCQHTIFYSDMLHPNASTCSCISVRAWKRSVRSAW